MKYGYKKLLSEKQFLKVQARARALQRDGTDLYAIVYNKNELIFKTRSATNRKIIWTQHIVIDELSLDKIANAKSFVDIEKLIKDSALKIYCDCPAFQFWGYKFMAWKRGYGLVKELRAPKIRNPHQQGFVCKHLYLIMQLYPFWSKALASKFRNYSNSKVVEQNPKPKSEVDQFIEDLDNGNEL